MEDKINNFVRETANVVEKEGKSKFSICDHRNWDRDLWDYRETIFRKLRERKYNVSTSINWGVMDVTVTLQF